MELEIINRGRNNLQLRKIMQNGDVDTITRNLTRGDYCHYDDCNACPGDHNCDVAFEEIAADYAPTCVKDVVSQDLFIAKIKEAFDNAERPMYCVSVGFRESFSDLVYQRAHDEPTRICDFNAVRLKLVDGEVVMTID